MILSSEERAVGKENFHAAIGSKPVRRKLLEESIRKDGKGVASKDGLGALYFGYQPVAEPVRVGVIGTGDEGSVLIGAINPKYIAVRAIADIRPYNVWRAFHGDYSTDAALAGRPGLQAVYGWKSEDAARKEVKVYGDYKELIAHAKDDKLEAVIIALPLHLHAPVAIAAMQAGLHVITEKLMGHTVCQCKEMALTAKQTDRLLATGHQRHYSILYDNAVELLRQGLLGELHYIRAQWHRGNLPGHDSWQPPLPESVKPHDRLAKHLAKQLDTAEKQLAKARGAAIDLCQKRVDQAKAQIADKIVEAEKFGYQRKQIVGADGQVVYEGPAIEELIRWRLWDRTGAGMMAELGSHQLDAASICIAAVHGGVKQHPLTRGRRRQPPPLPRRSRHRGSRLLHLRVPRPGLQRRRPRRRREEDRRPVRLDQRQRLRRLRRNRAGDRRHPGPRARAGRDALQGRQYRSQDEGAGRQEEKGQPDAKPSLEIDENGDEQSAAIGRLAMLPAGRGYAEELEHWAWCIRNRDPENLPHCHPTVALGDAVIALVANKAVREGLPHRLQARVVRSRETGHPRGR